MRGLKGEIRVVPDKSLTHRGAIFASLTRGRTTLTRPNPGADCRATLRAVAALGARVLDDGPEEWVIESDGRLQEPGDVLDLGNSGTGIRLLSGLVAGIPGLTVLTGDSSLRARPMARIVEPLRQMGARVAARSGERAPLAIDGGGLRPTLHRSRVASAQVKSCLLLAGLSLRDGGLELHEPERSRDHTERLLRFYGVPIEVGERNVVLPAGPYFAAGSGEVGGRPLDARCWAVPGDISAATFFLVGGLLVPGSDLTIEDVGLNPTRTGALDVLLRMGAGIESETTSLEPEPLGRIRVRTTALRSTVVEKAEIPRLVDEVPILALAAAAAEGTTEFRGIDELRHKESDRVRTTLGILRVLGVDAEDSEDTLFVRGRGDSLQFSGGRIESHGDHRIAMTGLIASLLTRTELQVDSREMIATSDPGFEATLASLQEGGVR